MRQATTYSITNMAISTDERTFFIQLGARIAELRKIRDITQSELAESLGVSQQTVNSYETGRRRVPVSALTQIATLLSVSLEELLEDNDSQKKRASKRGPASKLQQQIDVIRQLPKSKQKLAVDMLDAIIQQKKSTNGPGSPP